MAAVSDLGISMPLRLVEVAEAFAIRDNVGRSVAYVYWCEDEQRRSVAMRLTKAEARCVAQITARALTEAARNAKRAPPA